MYIAQFFLHDRSTYCNFSEFLLSEVLTGLKSNKKLQEKFIMFLSFTNISHKQPFLFVQTLSDLTRALSTKSRDKYKKLHMKQIFDDLMNPNRLDLES